MQLGQQETNPIGPRWPSSLLVETVYGRGPGGVLDLNYGHPVGDHSCCPVLKGDGVHSHLCTGKEGLRGYFGPGQRLAWERNS